MIGCVCLKCRTLSEHVTREELPDLNCEYDGELLEVSQDMERHRNYYYVCPNVSETGKKTILLPHWSELFPYSGLAADQDIVR